METKVKTLELEIEKGRKEIHTDGYPMSIGEIVSMYQAGDIDIHPEFQRFFRWTDEQKSKLIESILLGIPIPPIFVSQREDGVWDVVDGLQRLSTIFEFVGILKNEEGKVLPQSTLLKTEYLPSIAGMVWQLEEGNGEEFSDAIRRAFKREKLSFVIVKRESDPSTKFELFQRLNTLGSKLSDQEVRNCLLVMIDRTFYIWLKELSDLEFFQNAISLSKRQDDLQYDLELALRFLLLVDVSNDDLRKVGDIGEYLTDTMRARAVDANFDRVKHKDLFVRTFRLLNEAIDDEAFKRFDQTRDRFVGGFSISAFESISLGVANNIDQWESLNPAERPNLLRTKHTEMRKNPEFLSFSGAGVTSSLRIPKIVPLGRRMMRP